MHYPQGINMTEGEKDIELLRLGACPSPVAIAIGGGGTSSSGGGGSGFVNYTMDLKAESYLKMQADILFLKHDNRILRQSIQPCMWFLHNVTG